MGGGGGGVGGVGWWFFFFKQKTAYEIVSRDWSSDVCSSDLAPVSFILLHHHDLKSFVNHTAICGISNIEDL